MRYSQVFSKTLKTAPADATSINHKLLVQGGFVHQELAGVFSYLPLGLRVLNKVENIVRDEMNKLGASEMLLSALQPKENWKQTGRWDSVDVLFKVPSQTKNEYALGPSHEEIATPIARQYIQSYKDLPRALYQIQTKFRDELRAKSGIIRGREFRMKDLYSFHATQEDLEQYYNKVIEAYLRVYTRMKLEAKVVEAPGGDFSDKLSHEFQVITPAGEDVIIYCEKCTYGRNTEVKGDTKKCPKCDGSLKEAKSVEVGNIYDLETKYSASMDLTYEDQDKKRKNPLMGCYGIGTSRLVGTLVEVHHDDRGIVWPESVAPFHVHLVGLDLDNEDVKNKADAYYEELSEQGIEVLYDDRQTERPGSKFATADLIGIPHRLVVSAKTIKAGIVEWKKRDAEKAEMLDPSDVLGKIR